MKIIGLTGGIACGKSTIASLLKSMGASIVDADAINAQLTAPGGEALPLIHEAFGDFVFYPDGTLNRPVLSSIVFGNEDALQRLNAATHPLIQKHMLEQIETCRKMGALVVVLDVPLLFETGLSSLKKSRSSASRPAAVWTASRRCAASTASGPFRKRSAAATSSSIPTSPRRNFAARCTPSICSGATRNSHSERNCHERSSRLFPQPGR